MAVSNHVSLSEDMCRDMLCELPLKGLQPVEHFEAPWLRNPGTKHKMHMDFAWPAHKVALEYQGIQHYRDLKRFGDSSAQRVRDSHRKNILEVNGWKLFTVDIGGLDADAFASRFIRPFTALVASHGYDQIELYRINEKLRSWKTGNRTTRTQIHFASMGIRRDLLHLYTKPGLWALLQRILSAPCKTLSPV